jgi:selenocysteine lyase/cysteine desulfurase
MPSASETVYRLESRVRLPALLGAELRVPLVTGDPVRFVNLDYAASAPCLEAASRAVQQALPWSGSVHRGAGYNSQVSTALYAAARERVAAFAGARRTDLTIFTRNSTEALNLLAKALPADTGIVTFASEHHANLLPWRRRGAVELPVPRERSKVVEQAAAALRALPNEHKLLAVAGASNVTGELWPLEELVAAAHLCGARVVVDAAQLAPHRPIGLAALGADWLCLSAHKLYAPFGGGALIGRRDWLDAAEPWLDGGGASKRVTASNTDWVDGAGRHEAGTPNLPGAVAFAAACDELSRAGWDKIIAHEAALTAALLRGLSKLDGVEVLSLWGEECPRIGVVSFTVRGWKPGLLAAALSAEHGIGVRHGAFCAHRLVAELTGGEDGSGGGAVRASFGLGSTAADVERLLCALDSLLESGPQWKYVCEDGRYAPSPDPRPLPGAALPIPLSLPA